MCARLHVKQNYVDVDVDVRYTSARWRSWWIRARLISSFLSKKLTPKKTTLHSLVPELLGDGKIYLRKCKAPPFLSWVTRLLKFAAIADVVILPLFPLCNHPFSLTGKPITRPQANPGNRRAGLRRGGGGTGCLLPRNWLMACAAGCGRIFSTGLIIMGLQFSIE